MSIIKKTFVYLTVDCFNYGDFVISEWIILKLRGELIEVQIPIFIILYAIT